MAWQEASSLALHLHSIFDVRRARSYPGLRDQILRAAGSVPDNLAEGCAKRSRPELVRYADMAYASVKEVESQLERARGIGVLTEEEFAELSGQADVVAKLCFGLARQK